MRKTQALLAHALVLAGLALAACGGGGGGGGNSGPGPMPPTMAIRQEDNFGLGFGAIFRANPNSEPTRPAPTDIMAQDLSAEPRPVM
jgi:hypothetical protein